MSDFIRILLLSCIFILIYANVSTAQSDAISWSELLPNGKRRVAANVLPLKESYVLITAEKSKKLPIFILPSITILNHDLSFKLKQADNCYHFQNLEYTGSFVAENVPYILTEKVEIEFDSSKVNKDELNYESYLTKSVECLRVDPNSACIDSVFTLIPKYVFPKKTHFNSDFRLSPNGRVMATILYEDPLYERIPGTVWLHNNAIDSLFLTITDFETGVITRDTIRFGDREIGELLYFKDFAVSNEGKTAFVTDHKIRFLPVRDDRIYRKTVFYFADINGGVRRYSPDVGLKFLHNLKPLFDEENNFHCGGFFGFKSYRSSKGLYYLKIDKEQKHLLISEFQEFDQELLRTFMSKAKAEGKGEIVDYDLYNFMILPNKKIVLGAEMQRLRNGSYQTEHSLFFQLSEKGKLEWTYNLVKIQSGIGNKVQFLSHSIFPNAEGFDLIYQKSAKPDGKAELLSFGKQGLESRKAMFKTRSFSTILCPALSKKLNEAELLLLTQTAYQRNTMLGKLKLKAMK